MIAAIPCWHDASHRCAVHFPLPGCFVGIEIVEVPVGCAQRLAQFGHLLAFNLLKHEQKLSVVNATIQKRTSYTEALKSKEELLVQVCR